MNTDRIDQSFAAKQKMVEKILVRPTGKPQQKQNSASPPRPPRQGWKPAVRPENNSRLAGSEYDKMPASDEFTTQQTSGEYDKLPSSAEFDKPSASNPYDKLPTNAEYEAMRANGAQVKSSNPYDKLPTNAEYEAVRANESRVKPSNPYDKLPTNEEYEAMRANGAQVKPTNGKWSPSAYPQVKNANAPLAKESPYGRPIKVDASQNGVSLKNSPKSVEVETPLPLAKNTRQQVQLPETGHVATGRFVLATGSNFIQKNEQNQLVHYDSDHLSPEARKIITDSINHQESLQVSTHKNELKVTPVQKR
jgi:hypothetical protein